MKKVAVCLVVLGLVACQNKKEESAYKPAAKKVAGSDTSKENAEAAKKPTVFTAHALDAETGVSCSQITYEKAIAKEDIESNGMVAGECPAKNLANEPIIKKCPSKKFPEVKAEGQTVVYKSNLIDEEGNTVPIGPLQAQAFCDAVAKDSEEIESEDI